MTTRKPALPAFVLAASLLCSPGGIAFAETIEIPPAADTSLRSGFEADSNMGAEAELLFGTSTQGTPQNHALLRFDLSSIPANAVLQSVSLRFFVTSFNHPAMMYDLNRLLVEWGEGTNVFRLPAQTGDATWNSRLHGIALWTEPGGGAGADYVAAPSATALLNTGTNEFTADGLKTDVEFWLQNPASNFGWILHPSSTAVSTGKKMASREDADLGPRLIIEYTLPETPAPVLGSPRLVGNEIRFTFNALANQAYHVEFTDLLSSGSWEVLTNIPPQDEDTSIEVIGTASGAERYYRARIP